MRRVLVGAFLLGIMVIITSETASACFRRRACFQRCSPPYCEPAPRPLTVESALAPQPMGIYTDAEIEKKLTRFIIGKEPDTGARGNSFVDLDVVPDGESRPRGEVFRRLGLDDARIRDFRVGQVNFLVFLDWQISPSYDISCMTAANDPENKGLKLTDPKRKVYGIRLFKRSE